jgi:hypothetical protein
MRRECLRRGLALAAIVVLHLLGARTAGAACQSTCTRELADCKRTCSGRGQLRRDCRTACAERTSCASPRAGVRTMSYVLTECTTDASGTAISARQALMVRRGNCDPVAVHEIALTPLGSAWADICRSFSLRRSGDYSVEHGVFHRTAVLPNGAGVVFEVTNELSTVPQLTPEPPDEGIFVVRADGSGRRRLGPASAMPTFAVANGNVAAAGTQLSFAVSPDGRIIAFSDLGPDGETSQIFVLDVATGARTQVTSLPASPDAVKPVLSCLTFLNDRTLGFCIREYVPANDIFLITAGFTVRTDGSRFAEVPSVALPGAEVIPKFGVAGGRKIGMTVVFFPAEHVDHYPEFDDIPIVEELFLVDAENVVQLTDFGRSDTARSGRGGVVAGGRVFFGASADPFGMYPGQHCQIFSINTRGEPASLRQLTQLHDPDGRASEVGCFNSIYDADTSACSIERYFADRRTGAVTFTSNCDPVGRNPHGFQIFNMRADGSGLRQLTDARGIATDADGTVHVELPGPVSVQ